MTVDTGQRFSWQWRDEHAAGGDRALGMVDSILAGGQGVDGLTMLQLAMVGALADVAAAHYAAANVWPEVEVRERS